MDIKHLLCHPCDPYPVSSEIGDKKSPSSTVCIQSATVYDPIREHNWYDSSNVIVPHSTPAYQVTMPSSPPPPGLVRSRTSSDVSSVASASPKEWPMYPTTPRDDDLSVSPYFGSGPSTSTGSSTISSNSSMARYRAPSRRSRSPSTAGSNTANTPVQTRMAWTPTEDDLLQQGYDEGLSWAMISATYLPHRSRGCCWGRFKTLQSKNLVDPKRQNARLFRRPWKAIHGVNKRHWYDKHYLYSPNLLGERPTIPFSHFPFTCPFSSTLLSLPFSSLPILHRGTYFSLPFSFFCPFLNKLMQCWHSNTQNPHLSFNKPTSILVFTAANMPGASLYTYHSTFL